ncbi:hypothetical protein TcCL_NonESM09086 [Trypanosoma cruzi]|nr:hypothetical protein TcCL_NonESM09086 [Trypanosoma cruzi]
MDKKERSATSPSSTPFSQPTDMATSPQPAQGAHTHTHTTSHTWKRIPNHPRRGDPNLHCHPALNGMPRLTPCSHTRCTTPAEKESRAAHSLLPALHSHGRRQPPPHAAASMHHKRSIQIHCNVHLVCVCACRNTKQNIRKKGAEYAERRTKMYSGGAWRKQQQEDRSNS